jgi:predicted nuclease of predicted toxin-antitoxin system
MRILIDMNLSPDWVNEFKHHNIEAIHWSDAGDIGAPDLIIMDWARENEYIVFTHDLDFGTALALTKAEKPSVIRVRTQNVTVTHLSKMVISSLETYADSLLCWMKIKGASGYFHCKNIQIGFCLLNNLLLRS